MAYAINSNSCNGCGACEDVCPNGAISYSFKSGLYAIAEAKCKECKGAFDFAQCVKVCPTRACKRA